MGNRLSRITTRTGDGGKTGLADGSRVDKDAPRMEAIGTVDELNSQIGFARALIAAGELAALQEALARVQRDLFDLGGVLSRPGAPLLTEAHVERLDALVAELNAPLSPLKEFILPGGSPASGAMHVARSLCRRAERRLISALEGEGEAGPFAVAYLNRLSDVLFIAARIVGQADGSEEQHW